MREMEIDWVSVQEYVVKTGWDITKEEDPYLLQKAPDRWPAYLADLIDEQIKAGMRFGQIKYPVISADLVRECSAGNKHFFSLTIYSDGISEITATVALGDVDNLPKMMTFIDETLADHEEEE